MVSIFVLWRFKIGPIFGGRFLHCDCDYIFFVAFLYRLQITRLIFQKPMFSYRYPHMVGLEDRRHSVSAEFSELRRVGTEAIRRFCCVCVSYIV